MPPTAEHAAPPSTQASGFATFSTVAATSVAACWRIFKVPSVGGVPGAQMAPHEVPLKTVQWDPDAQQQSWVESGE